MRGDDLAESARGRFQRELPGDRPMPLIATLADLRLREAVVRVDHLRQSGSFGANAAQIRWRVGHALHAHHHAALRLDLEPAPHAAIRADCLTTSGLTFADRHERRLSLLLEWVQSLFLKKMTRQQIASLVPGLYKYHRC